MLFKDAAAFFCQRYPSAFLSRAAFAQQEGLDDPDSLAAELATLQAAAESGLPAGRSRGVATARFPAASEAAAEKSLRSLPAPAET